MSKRQIIIVEGQMDVITAHQNGIRNVAATSGIALALEQVASLAIDYDEILLAFDSDEAGQKATERASEVIGKWNSMSQNIKLQLMNKQILEQLDYFDAIALGKEIRGGAQERKESLRVLEDELLEDIVSEEPQWVAACRKEYLEGELKKLDSAIANYSNIIAKCNSTNEEFFAEYINSELLQPLFKEARKYQNELELWERKDYIEPDGKLTDVDIQVAKEVPIENFVDIAREDYKRLWALCPFHNENTPSFCVYKENNSFYCFSCGQGGDVIAFFMKLNDCNFIEACRFLLKRY